MGSVQEYTVDQERSKVLSAFWKRNGFAYQFTFSGKQKKKNISNILLTKSVTMVFFKCIWDGGQSINVVSE